MSRIERNYQKYTVFERWQWDDENDDFHKNHRGHRALEGSNNQNDNLNENYTKFVKAEAMEHDRTQGKQWNCPTFNLSRAAMDCSLIMGNRAYFLIKQVICQGNPLLPPAPKPMYAIYFWM